MRFLALVMVTFGCATTTATNTESVAPLKWEENHKERAPWSLQVMKQFKENLSSFEKASDVKTFCPKFSSLDESKKVHALSTMAVAIALYESSYNPNSIYHEPPPLGIDSVGLYQLSYEDKFSWCNLDRKSKTLQNPMINIDCAIPKMAKLAAQDGIISGGSTGAWRGLARYWSVMRPSGKKGKIQEAVLGLSFCK